MRSVFPLRLVAASWIVVTGCLAASADEGMWLFNDLPRDHLKADYDFDPTDQWARHVMRASVRVNSGGSGSFVSETGLMLTNHHVGADTLHKLSTPEHNCHVDGFYAETLADEIKAPDLELSQLVAIEDVTDQVTAAVTIDMAAPEALAARRAVISRIEKESLDRTGLRGEVVALYGGAKFHLYQYKKYTDVRLVWAPESAIAYFGGDADNFEYPRYSLDACLFRAYEDDKPARTEHYFKVSERGVSEGELVFISGSPGRTQRIFTAAALEFQRDHQVPFVLNHLRRQEILFQQFGLRGDEARRRARKYLLGVENGRKACTGMLQGLQDPALLSRKRADEADVRAKVEADPKLRQYADAWEAVERIQTRRAELLEIMAGFGGQHYQIAETLVFLSAENQKPNAQRLPEYRESSRATLERQLFSPAPIHDDLECARLADALSLFVERRGGDDPLVQKVLDGKSPRERAAELIDGTALADVAFRRELAEGGRAAVEASADPLIRLALLMEPEARSHRARQDELDELETQAYARITAATYAVTGASTYPDATSTLRLSFGPVKGYVEAGQVIPPWTTVAGAFEHERTHGAKPPWRLPRSWTLNRDSLDPDTPFNFVCTADIIGGNSGSPVINRRAELVGLVFDGNLQSLPGRYSYSDDMARAVSVDSRILLESLRKVYKAQRLVDELQ